MVLCVVALVVFGVLGIFSAKYRKLARQAFDCTIKTVTLRPCDTGLDEKIKTKIISVLLKVNTPTAKFANKNYNVLSKLAGVIFFILFFGSLFFTVQGIYNYTAFGNCNGPNSTKFCAFDALLGKDNANAPFIAPTVLASDLKIGSPFASVTVIEFGCYSCPYTKGSEDTRKKLVEKYGKEVLFVFKPFPLPNHNNSRELAAASLARSNWEFHNLIFENQKYFRSASREEAIAKLEELGVSKFEFDNREVAKLVEENYKQGINAKIAGTPTFFIGNASFINPTLNQMDRAIQTALNGQVINRTTATKLESCPA